MVNPGIARRLSRVSRHGRFFLVALDHGMTMGPLKGISDPTAITNWLTTGHLTGVVAHKGLLPAIQIPSDLGLIVHLSASSNLNPHFKVKGLITTVRHAVRLGADCVSIHVNFGLRRGQQMLLDLGRTVEDCWEFQVPLLAMVYAFSADGQPSNDHHLVQAARSAYEAGANILKVSWPCSTEALHDIVEACPVPVLLAGGSRLEHQHLIDRIIQAMEAGMKGVCFGRNIFGVDDPVEFLRSLSGCVGAD